MAIATRITTTLNPTITTLALNNAIKTAFSSIGLNHFDEYLSGTTRFLVYEVVYNPGTAFGRVYNRIGITSSLVISQELFTAWNTATKTGTNSSGVVNYITLSSSALITINAFNGGDEYKFVDITQNSSTCTLGVLLPQFKPDWWDTNTYPYGFTCVGTSAITAFRGLTPNPYNNTGYTGIPLNNTILSNDNLITNQPDVIKGICIYSSSNRGIAARTSDDIGACPSLSKTRFTEISLSDGTKYMILKAANGGLCLRTQ